ncbi:Protein CBG24798 [Caenorhabditis briggsae]|uniref:Protein CBG24300 n=1 Tax=Caenorhabditis briggsae TaxID=6238 RepID=G2J689_CAEBR|nr:Protein CBG24300 [Caenorhabditis briggsae]XP_002648504.1 Protein CBG24798 [Caenorhabditis briggsae]CAP20942.1 Protein CBG24300 [Caenorhabditis briggsae]CAP21328.1 Protein CBG24798 [Caenorhabditis briggsae]
MESRTCKKSIITLPLEDQKAFQLTSEKNSVTGEEGFLRIHEFFLSSSTQLFPMSAVTNNSSVFEILLKDVMDAPFTNGTAYVRLLLLML